MRIHPCARELPSSPRRPDSAAGSSTSTARCGAHDGNVQDPARPTAGPPRAENRKTTGSERAGKPRSPATIKTTLTDHGPKPGAEAPHKSPKCIYCPGAPAWESPVVNGERGMSLARRHSQMGNPVPVNGGNPPIKSAASQTRCSVNAYPSPSKKLSPATRHETWPRANWPGRVRKKNK